MLFWSTSSKRVSIMLTDCYTYVNYVSWWCGSWHYGIKDPVNWTWKLKRLWYACLWHPKQNLPNISFKNIISRFILMLYVFKINLYQKGNHKTLQSQMKERGKKMKLIISMFFWGFSMRKKKSKDFSFKHSGLCVL